MERHRRRVCVPSRDLRMRSNPRTEGLPVAACGCLWLAVDPSGCQPCASRSPLPGVPGSGVAWPGWAGVRGEPWPAVALPTLSYLPVPRTEGRGLVAGQSGSTQSQHRPGGGGAPVGYHWRTLHNRLRGVLEIIFPTFTFCISAWKAISTRRCLISMAIRYARRLGKRAAV